MARFPMTAPEAFLPADLRGDDGPPPVRRPQAAFRPGIQLPRIPESAVPYTVTPDSMSVAAGLGFGGTASTARMAQYRDMLIARGYSPSEADELAYLEEKQAWKTRADKGLGRATSNVDANLDAAATPIALDPSSGGHMSVPPETPAQKQARMEGYKGDDARMQRFADNYNAATGHPEYGYDEGGNPAKLGRVDIDSPGRLKAARREARANSFNAPYNSEMESANNHMSDERRAQISADWDAAVAAREAKWARAEDERLAQNEAEVEKYGRGNDREVTKEQLQNRYMRKEAEARMRQNPAVVEARLKRMAADAGISMSEARELYNKGMEANGGGQTFDEFRRGTQELRDKATDRRNAERQAAKDNWRATATLAGGSQNINSGNRDIYNQAAKIKDPEKQQAFLAQFRQRQQGGGAGIPNSNDPRVIAAWLQNQTQERQMIAERELQERREKTQAERDASRDAIEAQRADDMKKWMAEHSAGQQRWQTEFEGKKTAEQREFEAKRDAERREYEDKWKERTENANKQAREDEQAEKERQHKERLGSQAGATAAAIAGANATVDAARVGATARAAEDEAKRKEEAARQQLQMRLAMQEKSPGLHDLISGNSNTEDAIRELKKIAAGADSFQWLPGGGFGLREATSMNDHLKRLATQAQQMGINSPLADPAHRRELIKRWGYSSGWAGGRGGWMGDWFHSMPEELQ